MVTARVWVFCLFANRITDVCCNCVIILTEDSLNRIKRIKWDHSSANQTILQVNIYFDGNPNRDSFDRWWFCPKTSRAKELKK